MRNIESHIQQTCVKWFRLQYPAIGNLLFAVPNGGQRNRITASILKAEGVVSGVADLLLLVPNQDYHGLCIEMKRGKTMQSSKGVQSDNQKRWQALVESQGYAYRIAHSLDEFISLIRDYIRGASVPL